MNSGYGWIGAGGRNGRAYGAHQAAWIAWRGEIPPGKCVCHSCDVKVCVNPDHLYLATVAENTADAVARNRFKRGEARRNARLSDEMVRTIRRMRDEKSSSYKISEVIGVSARHVRLVLQGKIWGHVT